jgi:hypothetical protein
MALKELPKRYFKYMKADRLISMLKSPSIRFTAPDDLNDPYECHLTLEVPLVKSIFVEHLLSQKNSVSRTCAEQMANNNEKQLVIDALLEYRKHRNDLRVLSLTTNPLQLLMWAHYGDEHRGVVVELDIWHPSIRCGSSGGDKYSTVEEVKYTEDKVRGVPDPMTMISVLSRKSLEWKYESEWRLIRTKNMTREYKPGIDVVDLDISVIRSIYFGARVQNDKGQEIMDLVKLNGLEDMNLLKVDIAPHSFELRTTNVREYGWTLLHREHHFGEAAKEALLCLPMETDR